MPLTPTNQATLDDLRSREVYEATDLPAGATMKFATLGDDLGEAAMDLDDGDVLVVEDGDYKFGRLDSCAKNVTVMARNKLGATLKATAGDTIQMNDGAAIGGITFRGLVIEAGGRSAITTLSQTGPYRVNFEHCRIDGGWDHANGKPLPGFNDYGQWSGYWGANIYRWIGHAAWTDFVNMRREHGIYAHHPGGDLLFYKCRAMNNGRTGMQFVGRENEEGWADVQLAFVEGYYGNNGRRDGGSQLTAGGVREVYLEDCEWLLDKPALKGTGHLVCWDDKGRQKPCEVVEFRGTTEMYTGKGMASAPCIKITNSKRTIAGGRFIVDGGGQDPAWLAQGMPVSVEFTAPPLYTGKVKYV